MLGGGCGVSWVDACCRDVCVLVWLRLDAVCVMLGRVCVWMRLDAVCVLVLVCRDVCVLVWMVCRDVCVLVLVGSAWRDAWADEGQAWNLAAAGGGP